MTELTQKQWDEHWQRWYERAVKRGSTPNQAIVIAYREMGERGYGNRPPEETK